MPRENSRSPRRLIYNQTTDTADQANLKYQWIFFILNAKRETDIIRDKLLKHLATCDEMAELDNGIIIPKGSLTGRLITLKSSVGRIEDPRGIYAKNWHYDRNLKPMDDVQFDAYCDQFRKS